MELDQQLLANRNRRAISRESTRLVTFQNQVQISKSDQDRTLGEQNALMIEESFHR